MAKQSETTTKFKVDISELVKGMQTAKRQIALASAEFKAATAGMDDWSKSADGVSAKLTQLDKTLTSQKKILSNLEDQYELTAKQMGVDSKEAENLRIKIENQKASIAKTEKEIRKYNGALADIKGESSQAKTALEQLEDTISDQERRLSDLKVAYANASLEYGKNSREAKALAGEIRTLSSDLESSKDALNKTSGYADKLADSVKEAGQDAEKSSDGFTIMKGALANLVAEGISKAVDGFKELIGATDEASNKFQASTGASAKAMGEYNDAIETIYKNNFGESLGDVAEKMAKVKEVTGELDASKLQSMTEAAITLEDTFGMDMTETLRGVQSLMTHFSMSADEAFDLMASGAQNGLNYTDELGDNVSEYAGKFAEAGYTADEYFQLLKNGADGGAYNLDKVNDAINEVTTRLADGTIEDSIGMFSEETQDLFQMWKEGKVSQSDVISEIITDIRDATGEQDKMNLAAKAFGTMAEDGGTKFIESLSAVGDTFTDTKGKMDEIKQIRYDDVMSQLSGLGRTVKTDVITPFVEELLPYIKEGVQYVVDKMPAITEAIKPAADAVGEFISWIVDNKDIVIAGIAGIGAAMVAWNVVTTIQGVVKAIKAFKLANEGATIAQLALNFAMSLNPIGIVIALIAGLVTAFVVLWHKSEAFRNFWINLWEKIKEITGVVVDAVSEFFSNLWDKLKTGASAAWEGIKSIFSKVADFFRTTFEGAWSAVKAVFSTGGKIFDGIKEGIVSAFTATVNAIIRGINKVVSVPFNAINGVLDTIRNVEILKLKPFSSLGSISVPQIPELAGGIGRAKKGHQYLLEGNGDEMVLPLAKDSKWLDEVASRIVELGGRTGAQPQTVNNNYNYEYNQTNNSPKVLNRLEIYRQTRNQFNYAVGGA